MFHLCNWRLQLWNCVPIRWLLGVVYCTFIEHQYKAHHMQFLLRICFGILLGISVPGYGQLFSSCRPAAAQVDLDINNVRTTILNGGDMWWDLTTARYEIPKGSGKHSMFCGAIWIGGLDAMGNLHTSAMSYRQSGNDFFPGPLDTAYATTTDSLCGEYDRLWKVNRSDVESFIQNRNDPNYIIPDEILEWPGNGNTQRGIAHFLAPFQDVDGDGVYNALAGDYPRFNFTGQNNCDNDLLGDQAVWWVFNDNGNTHSETGGAALGIEVHAMAFAFRSSSDWLNDATFYRYKIINRSAVNYNNVWFAQWTDYDLGDAFDDYIGCDVGRGLGYVYNGDLYDGSSATPGSGTYGEHPPAIGVDFLSGPLAESGDMIDNDRDWTVDEAGERIILARSIYYTGDFTVQGNPSTPSGFYSYLRGHWKDDTPMTYGGNAYGGADICHFLWPGNSDPYGWGTFGVPMPPWDELMSGNLPSDRRQINTVGSFNLDAGEVDFITVGLPWARDTGGNNLDAITKLQQADDSIQLLFDNCFSLPCINQSAAEITFTLDDQLAYFNLFAGGTAWSWNFGDGQYSSQKHPSHYYTFPGDYTVCVSVTTPCGTLTDCDTIHIADQLDMCGPSIFRIEGQGNGNCEMEFNSQTIDEILASSDHRSLFPMYQGGHGPVKVSYEDYDALEDGDYRIAFDTVSFSARWKLWKVGGTDTVYSDSTIGSGNLQRLSMWGLGVQIQQVNPPGLDRNADRNGYLTSSVSFANPSKNWLAGVQDNDFYGMDNWIRGGVHSTTGVCNADFNDRFVGINSIDKDENFENINGGTWAPYRLCSYNPTPTQVTICYNYGPAWLPTAVAAIQNKIENISNVDIVITSDKTKWTRCCVIETGAQYLLNDGQREAMHLRDELSVDKNGRNITNGGIAGWNNPEAADYVGQTGMGWFPGYAINLETGERLNMAFGENSSLTSENGRDMLWNPTENEFQPLAGHLWGGCQYVYVFGHNGDAVYTTGPLSGLLKDMPIYDMGRAMFNIMSSDITANPELREVYADAMWTTIPVLNPGHSFMECDVTVKLRVQKPYANYQTDSIPENRNFPLYGFRVDKENLGCNVYNGDVMVYPNPFSEETVIQFDNTDNHNATVKLYDIQGKLVREYNGTFDRCVIPGAGLFSGMYVWTLEVDQEKPRTGKIILR